MAKRKPDQAHRETDKIIDGMEKEISSIYRQAHREATAKLNDYLARFEKKDETWREWVADGTKTEAEYKEWRKGQIMIGKRWEGLKDSLSEDYLNAHKIAESVVNGHMPDVYAINHNYSTFEIEKGSRIDTSYTLYDRQTVERLLRDNPKLYKRPGSQIQKDIQEGKIKAWDKKQIQSVMLQGILQGESIPDLAQRLKKVSGGELAAAIRNARTMTTGVQNAGRIDSMKRANDMGLKVKKQWIATLDDRTRHEHRQLDGEIVGIDDSFENDIGKIKYPGDPAADSENVYNCRCTLTYALDGHEVDASNMDLRRDDKLGGMSYDEWKEAKAESQPITAQKDKGEAIRQEYIDEYRKR